VQGAGGLAHLEDSFAAAQGRVEGSGHVHGVLVADLPEGPDDTRKTGQLERGGQVNGLVEQIGAGHHGGAAGGQVRQLRLGEVDRGEASHGQRVAVVVMEQEQVLGGVGGVGGAVAGEVDDGTARQVRDHAGPGRDAGRAAGRIRGGAGFGQQHRVRELAADPVDFSADMGELPAVGQPGGDGHGDDQGPADGTRRREVLAGVAQGPDGGGRGGNHPVHDRTPTGTGRIAVVTRGVHGQPAEQPARRPPHPGPRPIGRWLVVVAQRVQDGTGGAVPQPLQDAGQRGLRG